MLEGIEFANKEWFWALLIVPAILGYHIWQFKNYKAAIKLPTLHFFSGVSKSPKTYISQWLIVLRLFAICAIIVALARPQSSSSWQDINTEGIDIILALDISGSMLAEDLKPNRLEASKNVAVDFISKRPTDRIGLVVYSGESFTQCPLTSDHDVLKNLFGDIKNGMIEDGTAIGMGLANAVNRLKNSEAKSKVVILLTDGYNTTGAIPPLTAADIAKTFGIRVYTIGVGTNGKAPYPMQTAFGIQYQQIDVKIDEPTLRQIAESTDGKYFRATDNEKLAEIYSAIDELEKSKIEVTEYKNKTEEFFPWLLVGLTLLVIEFLIRNTWLRAMV